MSKQAFTVIGAAGVVGGLLVWFAQPGRHRTSAATAAISAAAQAPERLDETKVLDKLHDLGGEDPPLSMKLARGALARNPDGPNAPELEWNIVKALYNMGRFEDAREEARKMVEAYPESSFTGDVVRHLLHPLPNPP